MSSIISQLARITCRIQVEFDGGHSSVGTGFFIGFDRQSSGGGILVLVTNRHVVQGGKLARIVLTAVDRTSRVQHREIVIADLQSQCVYHPDPSIDLACLAVGGIWNALEAEGLTCQHVALGLNTIPSEEASIGDVEEILMVGYPSGLFDQTNNRPVVRRGITATAYSFDYGGEPNFLIDAAVFPGSSGSPVVIANHGAFSQGGTLVMGSRFHLLGVTFAVHQFSANGEVKAVPIPAHANSLATTQIPMNLGYCVKSRMLISLIEAVRNAAQAQYALQKAPPGLSPFGPSPFGGYLIR